jgi:hypothetical protein
MAVDQREFYAKEDAIIQRTEPDRNDRILGFGVSRRVAKMIANALNLYRPKVRRRKSAEKAV